MSVIGDELKICECKFCTYFDPKLTALMTRLSDEDQKFVIEIVNKLIDTEDERDVLQAKLDGTWPGWEWMQYRQTFNEL